MAVHITGWLKSIILCVDMCPVDRFLGYVYVRPTVYIWTQVYWFLEDVVTAIVKYLDIYSWSKFRSYGSILHILNPHWSFYVLHLQHQTEHYVL